MQPKMSSGVESPSLSTMVMIEAVGTVLFLALAGFIAYLHRVFTKKPLNGQRVLVRRLFRMRRSRKSQTNLLLISSQITNGESVLSQALAEELSSTHECSVILIRKTGARNENVGKVAPRVTSFECDVLSSEDLSKLSREIDQTFREVDLLIDNGFPSGVEAPQPDDGQEFVSSVGNRLRATINVSSSEERDEGNRGN